MPPRALALLGAPALWRAACGTADGGGGGPAEDNSTSGRCGTHVCGPARCGPQPCQGAFVLDGDAHGLPYDGHGGVSVGGSSRLLHDYPEPQRSEVLDYLFLPGLGASLHALKVEVGGDSRSGPGTEPSHMHSASDLSCDRGATFWLMREARLRNPSLVVHALPFAVPYWLGVRDAHQQGYHHGNDTIDYLVSWMQCATLTGAGGVDYLGNRNERSWGPPGWTVALRAALDAAGFAATRLVLPDGAYDPSVVTHVAAANGTGFAAAMASGAVAVHHPCHGYEPRPEVGQAGLKYFSSEDIAVHSDWGGAGCWGRALNQNFVRGNFTATLGRSLVWSAYTNESDESEGLVDAFEPWSGWYAVKAPAWVVAHTTHFVQVGWAALPASSGSSGILRRGGSFVTYLSPGRDNFTVVLEKLHGACRRCGETVTGAETVVFKLTGGLMEAAWAAPNGVLGLWTTNKTHTGLWTNLTVDPADGTFQFDAEPDSIYTVSTTVGSSRGSLGAAGPNSSARPAPFPVPMADDFESYADGASPRLFADLGGSWQVAPSPGTGRALKQWVTRQAGSNQWVADTEPITAVGVDLGNVAVAAEVFLPSTTREAAAAARASGPAPTTIQSASAGLCLAAAGAGWRGAPVRLLPCAPGAGAEFTLDAATGLLTAGSASRCLTARACPSTERSDLCLMDCGGAAGDARRAGGAGTCAVGAGCRRSASSCASDCAGGDVGEADRRAGQAWLWGEDGTVRLRADAALCLTAAPERQGAAARLLPCRGAHGLRQRWLAGYLGGSLASYAGLCVRLAPPPLGAAGRHRGRRGYCFHVGVDSAGSGRWQLERDGAVVLAGGALGAELLGGWLSLRLDARGPRLAAALGGPAGGANATVVDASYARGAAALHCGWGEAYFDNFELSSADPGSLGPVALNY